MKKEWTIIIVLLALLIILPFAIKKTGTETSTLEQSEKNTENNSTEYSEEDTEDKALDYSDHTNWAYYGDDTALEGTDTGIDVFMICPTVDYNDEANANGENWFSAQGM